MKSGTEGSAHDCANRRWSIEVLNSEIRQLVREQEHLLARSAERRLNGWERERITELLGELTNAVSTLAKISDAGVDITGCTRSGALIAEIVGAPVQADGLGLGPTAPVFVPRALRV